MEYIAPEFKKPSFSCPTCLAIAEMTWVDAVYAMESRGHTALFGGTRIYAAICRPNACVSLWASPGSSGNHHRTAVMIYPEKSAAPLPNKDLPPDATTLFNEARSVLQRSPRAAAALLRMCAEDLVNFLTPEKKSGTLNDRIGYLVKERDLPQNIQRALDSLRVIGSDAVHVMGEIIREDDQSTALKLFPLVNAIAYSMITQKNEIDRIYETKVPKTKREAIDRRDSAK